MAKNPSPYTCDNCTIYKTATNGWFIMIPKYTTRLINHQGLEAEAMVIMKWDGTIADIPEAIHICSTDCALRLVGREITKTFNNEVKP